jgi:hypothetical protein
MQGDAMRYVRWTALVLGAIPILAWFVSLPYNAMVLGKAFTVEAEWNNLPLWLATSPCVRIGNRLFDSSLFPDHRYALLLVYVAVATAVYASFGAVVGLGLWAWQRRRGDRPAA